MPSGTTTQSTCGKPSSIQAISPSRITPSTPTYTNEFDTSNSGPLKPGYYLRFRATALTLHYLRFRATALTLRLRALFLHLLDAAVEVDKRAVDLLSSSVV